MKILIVFGFVFFLSFLNSAFSSQKLLHLDPQMTGSEYYPILNSSKHIIHSLHLDSLNDMAPIIAVGKRNLDWLTHINTLRDADHKISFSSESTQQSFPLTAPRIYNGSIVLKNFEQWTQTAPLQLKTVLINGAPFTDQLPLDQDQYIEWGLKLDRIYALAARWTLMEPYLDELRQNEKDDIRGYFFLKNLPDLELKLSNFDEQDMALQIQIKSWLLSICFNSEGSHLFCDQSLDSAQASKAFLDFYKKYQIQADYIYNGFFDISNPRSDLIWTTPDVANIPFLDPNNPLILNFLKSNIEDEFKWGDWNLRLDFTTDLLNSITHVEFKPGVTPHVDGIGGSTITMDANSPISEYNVKWTIRHEYGHVLGFPDCYHEFYDSSIEAIINYQLDTTNLMCSRTGHFKQIHFDAIKKAYFH